MAATLAPPGNETQVASATCLVLPSSSNRQAALLHIRSICTAAAAGKPYRELCELESGIQEQLDSGTAADPEYWQVRDGWREAVLLLMLLPPERSSAAFDAVAAADDAAWEQPVQLAPTALRCMASHAPSIVIILYFG